MPRKSKARQTVLKSTRPDSGAIKEAAEASQMKSKFSVEDILNKAQSYVDSYDYDMAKRFCQRALEVDNKNLKALELTGLVMLETGDVDAAKRCFAHSIELAPIVNHTKYMYMGQLLTGHEAVNSFRKGIELMINSMEGQENVAANFEDSCPQPSMRDVSCAYLAIAEIFMTDLCDEETAEEMCVSHIQKAIDSDGTNPEAYQVMADYNIIKGDLEKAKEHIKRSVSLWLPKARMVDALPVAEDNASSNTDNVVAGETTSCIVTVSSSSSGQAVDPVDTIPLSPQAQLKAAKTLIEVEEYQDSSDILEILLDQDDMAVEVWYLLGWSNYLQGDDYKVTAKYYLQSCKELAEKVQYEDQPLLQHVEELLTELNNLPDGDTDEELVVESSDGEQPMEQE